MHEKRFYALMGYAGSHEWQRGESFERDSSYERLFVESVLHVLLFVGFSREGVYSGIQRIDE